MELIKLLLEGDHLATALEIQKSIEPAKDEIRKKFWTAVKEQLKKKLLGTGKDLKFFISKGFIEPRDGESGIDKEKKPFVIKVRLKELDDLHIMYALNYDSEYAYHGFLLAGSDEDEIMIKISNDDEAQQRLVGKFKKVFEGFKSSYGFIAWKYLDEKVDFDGFNEACIRLVDDEKRGEMVGVFVDTAVKTIEKYFANLHDSI